MGLEWIESKTESIAAAGWSTLGAVLKIKPDNELDLAKLGELLDRVSETIHDRPNRVRLQMNGFVIDAGSYVTVLTERSFEVADKMGLVKVDMCGTACKAPGARESVGKLRAAGKLGKKRKTAKC